MLRCSLKGMGTVNNIVAVVNLAVMKELRVQNGLKKISKSSM